MVYYSNYVGEEMQETVSDDKRGTQLYDDFDEIATVMGEKCVHRGRTTGSRDRA